MAKLVTKTIEADAETILLLRHILSTKAREFERAVETNKEKRKRWETEGGSVYDPERVPTSETTEEAWVRNARRCRNLAAQLA